MPERLVVNQSNLEKATSNTSHASASTIAMAMKGAATDKMSAGAGGEGQQMFVKNPTGVKARVHDSETGQKLEDKYEIDKKKVLGTGFCGSVFQAKNKYTNEVVAVKILKKDEIGADESAESHAELMKRLLNECEIYMNADHPNINRLRDMYETDSCIYLVCDCCTGGELYDKLITRVQYKEVDAAKAMKGMLLAVSYIHNTMNIVHRDLKLQNWLYPSRKSSDEQLKLIDFGFSKIVKGGKMMSTTAGTVEYLAPELLSHTTQVQPAGDMWAMGIIVFMLLGGYPPFSGKDNQEIIHAIRKNNIKWFKSRFENVSTQGKNMIFGLLERKPEKRLTALQALAHPWIRQLQERASYESAVLDSEVLIALQDFKTQSALHKATSMLMVQCLSQKEVEKLQRMYLSIDQTKEGTVQMWELRDALQKTLDKSIKMIQTDNQETELVNVGNKVDEAFVKEVFEGLAYNDEETIYFSDFLTAVMSKRLHCGSDNILQATFDRFDQEQTGMITVHNLRNLFGDSIFDSKVEDLIREADQNGDNMIDFKEFKNFIQTRGQVL